MSVVCNTVPPFWVLHMLLCKLGLLDDLSYFSYMLFYCIVDLFPVSDYVDGIMHWTHDVASGKTPHNGASISV